jgi:hypothetical protein
VKQCEDELAVMNMAVGAVMPAFEPCAAHPGRPPDDRSHGMAGTTEAP